MSSNRLPAFPREEVRLRAFLESEFCEERTRHRSELRAKPFRITARDVDLLVFIACHRFVEARHVTEWIGADRSVAYRRLSRLTSNGLVRYERIFHARPGIFQITNGGLAVAGSQLPKPKIDLATYRHEIGTVWLYLAARAGALGPWERLVTDREMRHHDQQPEREHSFGIALGGFDRGGWPRLHHPDLLVLRADRSAIALELELSLKGQRRLEEILLAYQLDDRMGRVIYLTDQPGVLRKLDRLVTHLNVAPRVVARYFSTWDHNGQEHTLASVLEGLREGSR